MSREQVVELIERAIAACVFPAATVEVGNSDGATWRQAFGTLVYPSQDPGASDPIAPNADRDVPVTTDDTVFDLASLAKPLSTATIAVQQILASELALDDLVSTCFAEWRGADRERATVRDLLEHASGLPARLVDRPPSTRREFEHEICAIRLEYELRAKSIYSDLGFILLGFLLTDVRRAPLAEQFSAIWSELQPASGEFLGPPVALPASVAPTVPLDDDERKGRVLSGEVHDSYAAALGRTLAGHSGLFGNAAGVGRFARAMLRGARGEGAASGPFSSAGVRLATTKTDVPASSRALGWDTMLPTSSCGEHLSPAAFGHVGFTGTSLWIDPRIDRYFVLLTNRAYGNGPIDQMRAVRRGFHDALASIDG
ncbi:MAG TPA: serine hydrolase domain-containing protein [Vicinamibacterales bacterium]|nr:serine hydrolase domain-containing protein [Vicinamibacterales bacterium]